MRETAFDGESWIAVRQSIESSLYDIACGSTSVFLGELRPHDELPLKVFLRAIEENEASVAEGSSEFWRGLVVSLKRSQKEKSNAKLPESLEALFVVKGEAHVPLHRDIYSLLPEQASFQQLFRFKATGVLSVLSNGTALSAGVIQGSAMGNGICLGEVTHGLTLRVISMGSTLPGAGVAREADDDEIGIIAAHGSQVSSLVDKGKAAAAWGISSSVIIEGKEYSVLNILGRVHDGQIWYVGTTNEYHTLIGDKRITRLGLESLIMSVKGVAHADVVEIPAPAQGMCAVVTMKDYGSLNGQVEVSIRDALKESIEYKPYAQLLQVVPFPATGSNEKYPDCRARLVQWATAAASR